VTGTSALLVVPLAHAGPGHTWQAMVVVAGVALAGFVLATALGRLTVETPDDLVLPLAASAIVSSLAPLGSEWLSDAIGWGLPIAVVCLLSLLLAAFTPLELRLPGPLAMGTIALAGVSAVVLYPTLTAELHPPAELLPLADDSELVIVSPAEDDVVPGGDVEVTVRVENGSIGPGGLTPAELPEDPEEAGALAAAIEEVRDDGATTQQQRIDLQLATQCTVETPCDEVVFTVPTEPGTTYQLTVDFYRGDGVPLAPLVRDRVVFATDG
jgi:hypothetical protein